MGRPSRQLLLKLWEQSCNNALSHEARLVHFGNAIADWIEGEQPVSLEVLGLDTASHNALLRAGLDTVQAIEGLSTQQLMLVRCIGLNRAIEIRQALQRWRTMQQRSCRANASG